MKLKKTGTIVLVCTLIISILAGSFGVVVAATHKAPTPDGDDGNGGSGGNGGGGGDNPPAYVNPTDPYSDFSNEITLQEGVKVLSDAESAAINAAVQSIENRTDNKNNDYLYVTLAGELEALSTQLVNGNIIYLQGDMGTPFREDRFFKVIACTSYGGVTRLSLDEPYMEEVFASMEVATSDLLTQENLVDAVFIEGVTAHYGDIDAEFNGEVQRESIGNDAISPLGSKESVKAQPLGIGSPADTAGESLAGSREVKPGLLGVGTPDAGAVENTATDYEAKGGDLIVNIDIDLGKKKEDDKKDDDALIEGKKSFGIKGQFGIRDLTAHLVCEMPEFAQFEELYLGLSGEKFVQVDLVGELSASAEMEDTKKDTWLCTIEGLKEKRFPIAVFQFKGKTPVYISDKQFDKKKESILPTMYIILYADWEGKISLELQGGLEYTHGFNEGLRVFKEGEPCLCFEDYPYTSPYDVEDDGLSWHVQLTVEAKTDLTLFGGSVVFYVAGINVGEISVLRLGIEADGKLTITASSKDGPDKPDPVDFKGYIRGYLRIIEVKVKIKVEGKGFLERVSFDVDFQFGLLDFTLFKVGTTPEKYKKTPVSSIPRPTSFESAITLVCDVSGSMDSKVGTGETKLAAAKAAAKTIVDSTAGWATNYEKNYGIGLVQFASIAKPVALPHIDYPFLSTCIDMMKDGGGTNIYAGIDAAVAQLDTVYAKNKVIILMTDGQDYYESKAKASAQAAADKGIALYTIGFGNDVDTSLLEELAEIANGEYRFASTDNVLGILKSFMSAQQSANGMLLAESEGTVSQGETTEAETFTVEDQQGDLMVYTAWPGSFLDTILIDPNGRKVDEDYPNVIIDKSSIPTSIIVKNPIPGEWKTQIVGVETSYDEEPYFTLVSFMETETKPLNEPLNTMQEAASYCMAIGFPVALFSLLLLIALGKKEKKQA